MGKKERIALSSNTKCSSQSDPTQHKPTPFTLVATCVSIVILLIDFGNDLAVLVDVLSDRRTKIGIAALGESLLRSVASRASNVCPAIHPLHFGNRPATPINILPDGCAGPALSPLSIAPLWFVGRLMRTRASLAPRVGLVSVAAGAPARSVATLP